MLTAQGNDKVGFLTSKKNQSQVKIGNDTALEHRPRKQIVRQHNEQSQIE